MLDLKNNGMTITEEGAKIIAEARATWMEKKQKFLHGKDADWGPCSGGQKTLGVNNRSIQIQSFFGCCEFQALLQRTDAVKIELDGNILGGGALILALALKVCQASDENKWIECRLLNFVTKKS